MSSAANASGVLPLLSFTLDELYSDLTRHGGTLLTYASYEALGRLEGAIATRAETVWQELPGAAHAALPRVLRALATVPDSVDRPPVGQPTRLEAFAEGSPARVLVDRFVAARLLVATDEASMPMVRVSHEALLTGRSVYELVLEKKLLSKEKLDEILQPAVLTKPRLILPSRE